MISDRSRASAGAAEPGGREGADQHRPEESQGGRGAEDLQSGCGEIHQPCHHVRTRMHTDLLFTKLYSAPVSIAAMCGKYKQKTEEYLDDKTL